MHNTTFFNYYALNIQVHMGSKIITSEKIKILKIFFYQSTQLIELSRNPKEFFLKGLFLPKWEFRCSCVSFSRPDLGIYRVCARARECMFVCLCSVCVCVCVCVHVCVCMCACVCVCERDI